LTASTPTGTTAAITRKPLDEEIDIHGLTHIGKVRRSNQDHFLVASLHKRIEVHCTSLPEVSQFKREDNRLAFLAMVADGVGGSADGGLASRLALEHVTLYVTRSLQCYYGADPRDPSFVDVLQQAALQTHAEVRQHAAHDPDLMGMATTLTVLIGVWPWGYIVQVGDSRYYGFRDGELRRITRDQTVAQDLLEAHERVVERDRWAERRSGGDAPANGLAQRAPAVHRWPHQACVRRAHQRAPRHDDVRAAGVRGTASGCPRRRGHRQHHHHRGPGGAKELKTDRGVAAPRHDAA